MDGDRYINRFIYLLTYLVTHSMISTLLFKKFSLSLFRSHYQYYFCFFFPLYLLHRCFDLYSSFYIPTPTLSISQHPKGLTLPFHHLHRQIQIKICSKKHVILGKECIDVLQTKHKNML